MAASWRNKLGCGFLLIYSSHVDSAESIQMRKALITIIVAGLQTGCNSRTSQAHDPNQEQGNPQAHPEKSATGESGREPSDNQAGKDAHSGTVVHSGKKL